MTVLFGTTAVPKQKLEECFSSHLSGAFLSNSPAPCDPLSCIALHTDSRVGAHCTPGME